MKKASNESNCNPDYNDDYYDYDYDDYNDYDDDDNDDDDVSYSVLLMQFIPLTSSLNQIVWIQDFHRHLFYDNN